MKTESQKKGMEILPENKLNMKYLTKIIFQQLKMMKFEQKFLLKMRNETN